MPWRKDIKNFVWHGKILNFSQLRQRNNTECSTFLYYTNSKGHSTLNSTTNFNRRVNKPSSATKLEDYWLVNSQALAIPNQIINIFFFYIMERYVKGQQAEISEPFILLCSLLQKNINWLLPSNGLAASLVKR